jgi:hypothetical protein
MAFTAIAAIALIVAAALLVTGEPKLTLRTSRPPHPLGPLPHGAGGRVLQTSASTPVEWILLVLAIIALGFAARLWFNWSRSRPPIAPAQQAPHPAPLRALRTRLGKKPLRLCR